MNCLNAFFLVLIPLVIPQSDALQVGDIGSFALNAKEWELELYVEDAKSQRDAFIFRNKSASIERFTVIRFRNRELKKGIGGYSDFTLDSVLFGVPVFAKQDLAAKTKTEMDDYATPKDIEPLRIPHPKKTARVVETTICYNDNQNTTWMNNSMITQRNGDVLIFVHTATRVIHPGMLRSYCFELKK